MNPTQPTLEPEFEGALWRLYRDFYDRAEKRRRWNIRDDIPWNDFNRQLDPAIADVVETFCCVELYLPDYISKILPVVRHSRARTWFYANWGYEESKHSMALGDWLMRCGHRTDEYMSDLEKTVFQRQWNLPEEGQYGMLAYAMVQEQATFINYRNLRQRVAAKGGDGALDTVLRYVMVDEAAHYGLFKEFFEMFLKLDRSAALEALRRVLFNFQMPAIHDLLGESKRRMAQVRDLEIFNEEIFFREVFHHVLQVLNVSKGELRKEPRQKKSLAV